jgi:hypothetical protein
MMVNSICKNSFTGGPAELTGSLTSFWMTAAMGETGGKRGDLKKCKKQMKRKPPNGSAKVTGILHFVQDDRDIERVWRREAAAI